MSKVSIVYWSGTGNTQKMAKAVAEGVKEAGAEADLKFVSAATVDELAAEPAFALGCPIRKNRIKRSFSRKSCFPIQP